VGLRRSCFSRLRIIGVHGLTLPIPGVFFEDLISGEGRVIEKSVVPKEGPSPSDSTQDSILSLYDRYFYVTPASTPQLLDAAYALRYQVYCVEHTFLDPAQQHGDREIDRYDEHSVHAVLIYRPTETVAGCVRLVLPQPGQPLSRLPMLEFVDEQTRHELGRCDPATTAEISRYAVSKTFRHRQGEDLYPDVGAPLRTGDFRRLLPHLTLGLLRGIAMLAAERGITTVCAAMSPPLGRLLDGWGLHFKSLGPLVDYHGQRQPCMAQCETLLAGMAARRSEYYEVVQAAYHRNRKRSVE
jgi:N-acyl amino acid synthase of PEP-CTERM/exosortase system